MTDLAMSASDPRAWISGALVFLVIWAGMWVYGRVVLWLNAERCACGTRLRICRPCGTARCYSCDPYGGDDCDRREVTR